MLRTPIPGGCAFKIFTHTHKHTHTHTSTNTRKKQTNRTLPTQSNTETASLKEAGFGNTQKHVDKDTPTKERTLQPFLLLNHFRRNLCLISPSATMPFLVLAASFSAAVAAALYYVGHEHTKMLSLALIGTFWNMFYAAKTTGSPMLATAQVSARVHPISRPFVAPFGAISGIHTMCSIFGGVSNVRACSAGFDTVAAVRVRSAMAQRVLPGVCVCVCVLSSLPPRRHCVSV